MLIDAFSGRRLDHWRPEVGVDSLGTAFTQYSGTQLIHTDQQATGYVMTDLSAATPPSIVPTRCPSSRSRRRRAISGVTAARAVDLGALHAAQDGWRLPNVKELSSLLATDQFPAIDPSAFPGTSDNFYWTSTPSSLIPLANWNHRWRVDFRNGEANDSSVGAHAVRLVK